MTEVRLYPLDHNRVALVDDSDAALLSRFNWHLDKNGYVFRIEGSGSRGTQKRYFMHREIMNAPSGMEVDHENSNRSDNQRRNLRLATHAQNISNQRKRANATSKFKGVSWCSERCKWVAKIKRQTLGRFDDELQAAKAYNAAALVHFGAFAKLNILHAKESRSLIQF